MRKTQIDRHACFWFCKLLPDHIDRLGEEARDTEEYEAVCINNKIGGAAEGLEEIQEKYEELRNRGIK